MLSLFLLVAHSCFHDRFYTELFGMKLLRQRDIPEEKYSNAFLGFGPEDSNFVVELTYSMLIYQLHHLALISIYLVMVYICVGTVSTFEIYIHPKY